MAGSVGLMGGLYWELCGFENGKMVISAGPCYRYICPGFDSLKVFLCMIGEARLVIFDF